MPTPLPRASYRSMTRADFGWEDSGSSRARTAQRPARPKPRRCCARYASPSRCFLRTAAPNCSTALDCHLDSAAAARLFGIFFVFQKMICARSAGARSARRAGA